MAQDLKYEFYEAVLRDAADSAAGRPETVWIVGEFGDDEPLFQRLQQEHGNVKKAVSRSRPTLKQERQKLTWQRPPITIARTAHHLIRLV